VNERIATTSRAGHEHSADDCAGTTCPCCGRSDAGAVVYRHGRVPVQSCLQPPSARAARAIARRPLELVACDGCGLVFNRCFDPATQRFDQGYEETQAFSPTFRRFAEGLAGDLVERWEPDGATIVEIGCGKGDFLESLCARGGCRGIGIDPAFEPDRRPPVAGVTFERRLFSTEDIGRKADFVVCRHTLEHIGPVGAFLAEVAEFCRAGGVRELFFEVPDAGRILAEGAFWDVYYEHANYFGADALRQAFGRAGMEVTGTAGLFHDQYLGLYARPAGDAPDARAGASATAPEASDRWRRLQAERDRWRRLLRDRPAPVVIWGSGSKGVAFLAGADPDRRVAAAVDINPHRQGRYMPGTGQPIIAPTALVELRPATVVVMNAAYAGEIRRELDRLGLAPEIHVLGPACADGAAV
jgi:SAM-dependent methyltransferase